MDLHNSNKHLAQTRLSGEIIPEEKFFLLGFVPAVILCFKIDTWFDILTSEQISAVNQYLEKNGQY